MNKTFKIYGILLIAVITLLTILKLNKTEVLDWRKNLDPRKKTPFGLFVFDQEANKLFSNQLERIKISPYDYYKQNKHLAPHNIFILNKEFDAESWKKILSQVEKGSNVLYFSDNYYDGDLSDTLVFSKYYIRHDIEKASLYLTDKKLKHDSINIDKRPSLIAFSEFPKNSEILGFINGIKEQNANFIKAPFGKGNFYLHSEPLILTNYYLLQPKGQAYIQNVISYLPNRKTLWFVEDYKYETTSSSIMRFILNNAGLRYAWWLLLSGLVLFAIFNAKRRQRIIPIIEPLKNKSIEFVKSVGNLYLQEGTLHDMMAKKTQYFLNKVRMELLIDTQNLDENFISKLHLKTGKSKELISEAVELMKKAQNPHALVTKEDLININKLLDQILK